MKIALVAPIEETIPPKKYGGTEWIVYELAQGLGEKGHSIDLYASGDTPFSSAFKLIPITNTAIRTDPVASVNFKMRESEKLLSIDRALSAIQKTQYDIIHNHAGWRFLTFSNLLNRPVVTTHHMPLNLAYQNLVFQEYKDSNHISISNNQRKDLPDLNFVGTVYNGTIVSKFPFLEYSDHHENNPYMFFLARMSEDKGAIEAAQATIQAKKKLIVAAKIDELSKSYFGKFQEFMYNDHVEFIGEIGPDKRLEYLQNARALLVPIQWEEPFGLMFTEAMSCGTPVITFSRGSSPEIVKDGVTGFLVNQSEEFRNGDWIIKKTGLDGLKEAIDRIYSMSKDEYINMRRESRKNVEEKFSSEKMVDEYLSAYNSILSIK